jgi:hypothetical protein
VKLDDYKNEFGVVFTGKLIAPRKGLVSLLPLQRRRRAHPHRRQGSRRLRRHPSRRRHQGKGHPCSTKERTNSASNTSRAAATSNSTPPGKARTSRSRRCRNGCIRTGKAAPKKKEFDPIPARREGRAGHLPQLHPGRRQSRHRRRLSRRHQPRVERREHEPRPHLARRFHRRRQALELTRRRPSEKPLGYDVLQPTGEVTPAFFVTDKPDAAWPKPGTKRSATTASNGKATRSTPNAPPPSATPGREPRSRRPSPPKATATSPMATPNSSAP